MEKAEILEMTVAYVSQLHGARCRSPSSDVITHAPRRKWHKKALDDLQEFDSSSSEYRAGFIECLTHVQRFLADQAAVTSAEMSSDVALSQLLINHLSQFVVDDRGSNDYDLVVKSAPASPDTTLGAMSSSDPSLPPLPSSSPSVKGRQSFPRCSALSASQTLLSVGNNALPSFLLPMSSAFRRDQLTGDVGLVTEQPLSSQYHLGSTVSVAPPVIIQPASFSLSSPSISMYVSSERSSPQCDKAAATCLQPASPGNAASDVWRPWRPETTTCLQYSDVSDDASAL